MPPLLMSCMCIYTVLHARFFVKLAVLAQSVADREGGQRFFWRMFRLMQGQPPLGENASCGGLVTLASGVFPPAESTLAPAQAPEETLAALTPDDTLRSYRDKNL